MFFCLIQQYLLFFLELFQLQVFVKIFHNLFVFFSEVKTYDPSGDSTLPTCSKKRKIEEVDKEDEITEKKAKKAKIKIKG